MKAIMKNRIDSILAFALIAAGAGLVLSHPLCASETDDRIESHFNKSWANRIFLNEDAIKLESRYGVATLTGQVNEASHKVMAEETVAGLPGVLRVDNRLEVKLEGTEKSDIWIRAKVRSVLALHRKVSGFGTQVDIRDGVITLRGTATSAAQKDLATEYAEDVHGVVRVMNVMTVVQTPAAAHEPVFEIIDDASITAQVKVALQLHRSTSSVSTKIETLDGVVTVSGLARNLAEKTLIAKLATDITGVRSVVDNMTIAQ